MDISLVAKLINKKVKIKINFKKGRFLLKKNKNKNQ